MRDDVNHGLQRGLLEAAIQALPVGVVVHDEQGRCILANAAARALGPTGIGEVSKAVLRCPGLSVFERAGGRILEAHSHSLPAIHADYRLMTITDVTQHHKLQQDLIARAFIDPLTGLPNRTMLETYIKEIIAVSRGIDKFAFAFIDIDDFKGVNDFYGHAAGDALLRKMADRIRGALRRNDMLVRLGGDEFVLLLSPVVDEAMTIAAVSNLSERLKQPLFIDGYELFASASIGISFFPSDGLTFEDLHKRADTAMYSVKESIKGGVGIFEEKMSRASTVRLALEQRLRLAIDDGQFCYALQPKIDIRTQAILGVEVLLRLRDEFGVMQDPGDLVELAHELDLIDGITVNLLSDVIRSINDIDACFEGKVHICINLSALQASDVPFMTTICEMLSASGAAERFVIELTEEAYFARGQFQSDVVPRIHAIGARIAIDEFGVGYSSLSALSSTLVEELKIDRSFIADIGNRPRSQIILRAIELLGQTLGVSVVAEGVDTYEELSYLLNETQVRYAQGAYFARAAPMNEFLDMKVKISA